MFNKSTFKISTPRENMRRPVAVFHARRKLLLVCLAGICLLSFLAGAAWIREQARRRLAQERARLANQDFIPFEKSARTPLSQTEIRFWQNTESTRAVIRFQDSYFAATDGGMVQFSADGNALRHYTVLDGLTESDLISLAVFDSKLFIGTATRGLLSFDGERFESYRWLDREPQAITSMLTDGGRLLIGTFGGGLIEFDGRRFTELKAGADHTRLLAVNCLFKTGSRLYVGTFNDGLWLLEAGRWLHFRLNDGLASNRVVGIATSGENIFVASDFGLATATSTGLLEADASGQKRFRTLATLPSLSGLVAYGGLLLITKDNGELLALDQEEAATRASLPVRNLGWPMPDDLSNSRLMMLDDRLWLLGSRGIWRTPEDALSQAPARLSLTRFNQTGESPALASNVISALALDRDGRFWAGNFRRGIDVLSGEGKKIAHLESEAIREINFLLPEANLGSSAVLAATSQGVVRFEAAEFRSTSTTKADGLPGNSIMHLAQAESGNSSAMNAVGASELVLATGRGLSLGQQGRWRALTTVQGLPSDQIYTALFFKRSLFVGTLGGLAQVESGRVVRVFKDSNSKLTHNWVTGLCAAGGRLFIGTYGGGVFELAASNDLYGFSQEIGTPVVNPNAMWSDGERLFVGTLDGAWVFDLQAQKWTHLKDELPARTVLSITGDAKYVYFGTTNGIARVEKSYLTGI
ncbi:MAG TPA: two-component regulator propeller domain-containing protein [Pyrinomonadaceae bacterium]|jgi:ligand-binding sensor domain-containing protein|nr:two-component regulator propeller domain-containing protein [Pyrinomonadaceae bacterium]